MGPVAEPIYAVVAVTALGEAVRQHNICVDIGVGIEAVVAEISRSV